MLSGVDASTAGVDAGLRKLVGTSYIPSSKYTELKVWSEVGYRYRDILESALSVLGSIFSDKQT